MIMFAIIECEISMCYLYFYSCWVVFVLKRFHTYMVSHSYIQTYLQIWVLLYDEDTVVIAYGFFQTTLAYDIWKR